MISSQGIGWYGFREIVEIYLLKELWEMLRGEELLGYGGSGIGWDGGDGVELGG